MFQVSSIFFVFKHFCQQILLRTVAYIGPFIFFKVVATNLKSLQRISKVVATNFKSRCNEFQKSLQRLLKFVATTLTCFISYTSTWSHSWSRHHHQRFNTTAINHTLAHFTLWSFSYIHISFHLTSYSSTYWTLLSLHKFHQHEQIHTWHTYLYSHLTST